MLRGLSEFFVNCGTYEYEIYIPCRCNRGPFVRPCQQGRLCRRVQPPACQMEMAFAKRGRLQLRRQLPRRRSFHIQYTQRQFQLRRQLPGPPAFEAGGRSRRAERALLSGQQPHRLHPAQRPVRQGSGRRQGDPPDFRRQRPHTQRLCLLGLLRGDFRPGLALQGLLVVTGRQPSGFLPLRQQRSALFPHLLALRRRRLPEQYPLPYGGAGESKGEDRHHRHGRAGKDRVGGLRRE